MPNAVTAQFTVAASSVSSRAKAGNIGTSATHTSIIAAVIIIDERHSIRIRGRSPAELATSAFAESAKASIGTSMKLQSI